MNIREYCKCGAMFGITAPTKVALEVRDMFWKGHEGEGHGSCDSKTAARARAKNEGQLPLSIGGNPEEVSRG